MNWVGGSRNRLLMKNDTKRQRAFFEKRRIQQRLRKLEIDLPASPSATNPASMDLVTLFVVNQIATRKESKDPPKVAVLGDCRGGAKRKSHQPLVLPMSPCSPSQLSLVQSQTRYSVQGGRKNVLPHGFKYRKLSPVLESAVSDNSASDYLPPSVEPLSPFSSTSSGQGCFPLQLNQQQRGPACCSPPPWDPSGPVPTPFQPFSQPRAMTEGISWSFGSNPALDQLRTPAAAAVLFGSPYDAREHTRNEEVFSLNKHMLDISLDQAECEQQFEDGLFEGFSHNPHDVDGFHFGSVKPKICLKDETSVKSTPQTVRVGQCFVELSARTDMNDCYPRQSTKGCQYSPSYSSRRNSSSADSSDDEGCCQTCCCAEAVNRNSRGNQSQSQFQPSPFTAHMKLWDHHIVVENERGPAQSSELSTCKKRATETRDAGTQTPVDFMADKCDAGTQCSLFSPRVFNLYPPPDDVSLQHSATGGQTGFTEETTWSSPASSVDSGKPKRQNQTPRIKETSRSGSPSEMIHNGVLRLQIPMNPFRGGVKEARGKQ